MNQETTYDVMQDPIVLAAMEFMMDAHRNHALKPDPVLGGQRRKYSKAHYEVHPIQVAKMVAKSIHNDAINVAVAILHDCEEDTKRGLGHIREFFGKRFGNDVAAEIVAGVAEVSDVSKPEDGNRKVRKEMDKLHSWNASPGRQTVKLADMKSNMPSIVANDPGFARKWVQEKKEQWAGFTQGDPKLYEDMRRMFEKFDARQDVKDPDWDLV
jgi:(p)ppGpp synthase/HD superfamily hydrolase